MDLRHSPGKWGFTGRALAALTPVRRFYLTGGSGPAPGIAFTVAAVLASLGQSSPGGAAPGGPLGRAAPAPLAGPDAHATRRPASTGALRWLPVRSGCFFMGSRDGYADERPRHRVCLTGFWAMQTEVTVAAYSQCVHAGRCSPPKTYAPGHPTRRLCNWARPGHRNHPVNCLSASQAARYCASVGGRLPTEAEWERAAAGARAGPYPWGRRAATANAAVIGRISPLGPHGTEPVGSRPLDRSRFGLLDVVGNVSEWVADWYEVRAYRHARQQDPRGPRQGRLHSVRGCSFRCKVGSLLLRRTARQVAGGWDPTIGFRCVRAREGRGGAR